MDNSIKSIGTVVETNGTKARVVFKRSKACGECRSCQSFGTDEAVIDIDNKLNAVPGDRVEIGLHASSIVNASLILYGIPLLALIIGVFFGCKLSDIWGAVIGIAASLFSLVVVHLFERRFSGKGKFDPVMLAVVRGTEEKNDTQE